MVAKVCKIAALMTCRVSSPKKSVRLWCFSTLVFGCFCEELAFFLSLKSYLNQQPPATDLTERYTVHMCSSGFTAKLVRLGISTSKSNF